MNKTEKIIKALRVIGIREFRNESSYSDSDAKRNLQGRTHYVDDDTMRYFKSRILRSHVSPSGLHYIIQESLPHPDHDKRVRRNVVFDVFGTVVNDREVFHTSAKLADNEYSILTGWMESVDSENEILTALTCKLNRDLQQINEAKAELI